VDILRIILTFCSIFGTFLNLVLSAEEIELKFFQPKSAITPGQSLVIYDEQGYVLAGGVIAKSIIQ